MPWISAGALLCALAVAAGAFGAHGLKTRLGEAELNLWETAARYLIYGGFAVVLFGLAGRLARRPMPPGAGWCLLAGAVVFSGTVFLLALGGPRWLGAVTPVGGLLLIAGFVLFAVHGLRL